MITSKTNGQLKNVRKLLDTSKARKEQGLFVIEGSKMVFELPTSFAEHVFVSESFLKEKKINEEEFASKYKAFDVVSDEVFKSISDTVTPQGILALVNIAALKRAKDLKNNQAKENEKQTILILDGIQDPGNLGTMIRTAEAAGISAVVMSKDCADIYNPKTIRSTMGSIFRVPTYTCDCIEKISELKKDGFSIYAAALDGAVAFNEIEYAKKSVLVIGNEANGISKEVLENSDVKVKIPMEGKVESLNAAVSAAVLMYHLK